VAQALVDRWVCVFGIPITILSDNGSAFASKFFHVLTNVLGVKHVFTSAYRPSTNGQVERFNATLVDCIAHLTAEKEWDMSLGLACLAYNSSVHSTTGYAPMELASTREPCPGIWSRRPSLIRRARDAKYRFRHQLLARAAKLCNAAHETMEIRLERYKRLYDYHVRKRHDNLEIGDSVLVRTYVLEPGRSSKLSFPVASPYPVLKIDGPNVEIRTREGSQTLRLDRVVKCPVDLPSGVEWAPSRASPAKIAAPTHEADDEHVIE
jgi:hypothetical protein